MGVHGLWRLIEPSGKPVPLETLENKTLAIDVSIWLHQAVKGFQDAKGAPVPNAHLLGIYHRLCKLLYFRVKPVFVFDGGVPMLKKQTIAKRNQLKSKNLSEAGRLHQNLLTTLLKHSAISKVLSEKTKSEIATISPPKLKPTVEDDLYVLPPTLLDSTVSSSDEETSTTEDSSPSKYWDLHSIDTKSAQFKSLPVDVRHEILTDLKETRKQNSWGRLHELPAQSDDFSIYQMNRLLKRQAVQAALEETEGEMGGHSLSLGELEKLLNDQGVITMDDKIGSRIASDENTRFLLIKNLKETVAKAKKEELEAIAEEGKEAEDPQGEITTKRDEETGEVVEEKKHEEFKEDEEQQGKNKGVEEFDSDLQRAIALSLQDEPSTSREIPKNGRTKHRLSSSFFDFFPEADFHDSDSDDEESVEEITAKLTPAQSYMMEYSGLTPSEISKIIASKTDAKKKKIINSTSALEDKKDEVSSSNDAINQDEVEIQSISSESTSSDDFLEVEGEDEVMEVVIQPIQELEDDLFKDVFDAKAEENKATNAEEKKQEDVTKSNDTMTDRTVSSTEKEVEEKQNQDGDVKRQNIVEKEDQNKVASSMETENLDLDKEQVNDLKTQEINSEKEKLVPSKPKLSILELNQIKDNLQEEQQELVAAKSAKERLASNITDQMYQEAQELLELFGVPYLVAPMEAEAQCAFLELVGLTDGTITDDSDIWLFGGRTVYKNFFNQNKHVMEFRSENIHNNFKLTREQMILLAMLVGSDYTTGLTGVGPVTALEILAAFPPKTPVLISGLAEFRSWFHKGKLPAPGRTSLRSKLKNVSFSENFPNPQIIQAYLEPQVETSKDTFTWGKPDVAGLTEFARRKFGWTTRKTEEIVNPVLKRLQEKNHQKTIRDFFKTTTRVNGDEAEKKMSKRVKTAVRKIGGVNSDTEEKDEDVEAKPKRKPRKKKIEEDGAEVKPKRQRKTAKVIDPEEAILKETKTRSRRRVKEIEAEVQAVVAGTAEAKEVKIVKPDLHKKEVIPQRQKDKSEMLRNKMRAIESFRKSKQGPGFVGKRGRPKRGPTGDAGYLSESSSD